MADWRQIRARIRRAKSGPDPATRLEQLFDKTRDGMVAFELAQLEEESGRIERAADWYKRAWQRFRRSEWKQKAEEALVRHGIPIPAEESPRQAEVAQPASAPDEISSEMNEKMDFEPHPAPEHVPAPEQIPELMSAVPEAPAAAEEPSVTPEQEKEGESEAVLAGESPAPVSTEAPARPRRRRHRGGRGRGRGKRAAETPAQTPPESDDHATAPVEAKEPEQPQQPEASNHDDHHERRTERRSERRPGRSSSRGSTRAYLPEVQIYRRGEPALASEIKALEAKLRQLLASPAQTLGEVGELPANPGVFLLSDLDLTTMYYLEACGNMRSALDQLVSGRRGRQGSVRSRLAKYLGISDSQAGRYLKEHCAARWIDLEESDSNALGHFARAVLRPELMEESD